jgi:hypothetical protein
MYLSETHFYMPRLGRARCVVSDHYSQFTRKKHETCRIFAALNQNELSSLDKPHYTWLALNL